MSQAREFTLTAEHVTLLRHAVVSWEDCEFGAPAIDCKRPYGNSDVIGDMVELLEVEGHRDQWGEDMISDADTFHLIELHRELETALQIVLGCGTFHPGRYVRSETWRNDWKLSEVGS